MSTAACVVPGAMLLALLVDRLFGEPAARVHPVVAMGRYLSAFESMLLSLSPKRAFVAGALAWGLGAAIVVALGQGIEALLWQWLNPSVSLVAALALSLALGVLLKPLLAWRMLEREVAAVERALAHGIGPARAQVARLVSRDTATLDTAEVRETAIETLAENLNDSVIAPLFWFALAGLPGAALYRFANTADAMWGYRGRWEWAGKWAARADDLLSWLPARLTALALMPVPARWCALRHEARRTPSPNGGWPMGAMALVLGVRLGKPGVYALNVSAPSPQMSHIGYALAHGRRAVAVCVPLLVALAVGVGMGRWQ
jgi:adenosylcobinamide-phosphate synthase